MPDLSNLGLFGPTNHKKTTSFQTPVNQAGLNLILLYAQNLIIELTVLSFFFVEFIHNSVP